MRRPPIFGLAALALVAAVIGCNGDGDGGPSGPNSQPTAEIPVPSPFAGITSEVVVSNADHPTALAFAPDGRLFYAEQNTGAVRVVDASGQLAAKPLVQTEVAQAPGWGLLGLAVDPQFAANGYIYVFLTRTVDADTAQPMVVRYTVQGNTASQPVTIIGDLPGAQIYGEYAVGGDIRFGPDGYLYVTVGDHISTDLSQDLSSPRGKILRVNRDGEAAPDNSFVGQAGADPRVFAYGFLDPHDMTFQPGTGQLFVTENGTYFCCDEVDAVRAGENYGWPEAGPEQTGVQPIHFLPLPNSDITGTKVRPEGIEFASGAKYPPLGDSLLVCEEVTKYMRRLVLSTANKVQSDNVVVPDCGLDIAISPDGTIYYSNPTEIRRLVSG